MLGDLLWAALEVRFECRACRQLSPLNHLETSGQIKCVHCGVDQRLEAICWQSVVEHAHAVADLAGPVANLRWANANPVTLSPFASVGQNTAFADLAIETLHVRSAPGHPLCDHCLTPLSIGHSTPTRLTVVCPSCQLQRSYDLPPPVLNLLPAVRGVVGAEHESGRRDVQTEVGAGGEVVVRCGNCTAPLQFPPGTSVCHCAFCKVACRITPEAMWRTGTRALQAHWWWLLLDGPSARRHRLTSVADLGAPSAPPVVAGGATLEHTRRRLRPSPRRLPFALIAAAVGCVALAVTGVLVLSATAGEPDVGGWDGAGAPLAYDVNGDGVFDIVGTVRSNRNEVRLSVFDGKNGHRLWQSKVLGTHSAGATSLQLADNTLLHYQDGGLLQGFDMRDGSQRFELRLNENIQRFCGAPEPGLVVIETKDERHHTLRLTDGGILKVETAEDCPHVEQSLPTPRLFRKADRGPIVGDRIDGMHTDEVLVDPASGTMFALGTKRPGTRVPRIAAFRWERGPERADLTEQLDQAERALESAPLEEKRALLAQVHELRRKIREWPQTNGWVGAPDVLWMTDIPGVNPLSVPEGHVSTASVGLNGDKVVVLYPTKTGSNDFRLTALSLESGKRKWDIKLDADTPFSGLLATPHHVFVSRSNGLFVYEVETGEFAYVIE